MKFRFKPCKNCCGEIVCLLKDGGTNCITELADQWTIRNGSFALVNEVNYCGIETWTWDGLQWNLFGSACTNDCESAGAPADHLEGETSREVYCVEGTHSNQAMFTWGETNKVWTLTTNNCIAPYTETPACTPSPPTENGTYDGETQWVNCPRWQAIRGSGLITTNGKKRGNYIIQCEVFAPEPNTAIRIVFDYDESNGKYKYAEFTIGQDCGWYFVSPEDISTNYYYGTIAIFDENGTQISATCRTTWLTQNHFENDYSYFTEDMHSLVLCATPSQVGDGQFLVTAGIKRTKVKYDSDWTLWGSCSTYTTITNPIVGYECATELVMDYFNVQRHHAGETGTLSGCPGCKPEKWYGTCAGVDVTASSSGDYTLLWSSGEYIPGNPWYPGYFQENDPLIWTSTTTLDEWLEFTFREPYNPTAINILGSWTGEEAIEVRVYNYITSAWEVPAFNFYGSYNGGLNIGSLTQDWGISTIEPNWNDWIYFGITNQHVSSTGKAKIRFQGGVGVLTIKNAQASTEYGDDPNQVQVEITCPSTVAGVWLLDRAGESRWATAPDAEKHLEFIIFPQYGDEAKPTWRVLHTGYLYWEAYQDNHTCFPMDGVELPIITGACSSPDDFVIVTGIYD